MPKNKEDSPPYDDLSKLGSDEHLLREPSSDPSF